MNRWKFNMLVLVMALVVRVNAAENENERQADKNQKAQDSYECKIAKYESTDSPEYKLAIPKFLVARNRPQDPVPAPPRFTGEGDDKIEWRITRYNGLISVEVRDDDGETLTISTTTDGNSLGVKIPSHNNILACNPPQRKTALKIDPKAYGRRLDRLQINPRAYGESIRGLDINPQSYGAYLQIQRVPTRDILRGLNRKRLRELLEESSNFFEKYLEDLEYSSPELYKSLMERMARE